MASETITGIPNRSQEAGNGFKKAEAEATQAAGPAPLDDVIARIVDKLGAKAGVQAAFGEPVTNGEVTVVPVARVRWGFGAGAGMGPDPKAQTEMSAPTSSGSGAGGAVGVTPIGYLDIRTSGAEFKPIEPITPSPLFVLVGGLTAWLVFRGIAGIIRAVR
jgi:uncharacterized spore protein YtfJ